MVDNIPAIWVKGVEDSEGSGQTNNPEIFLARTHECFLIARKGNPSIKKKGRSSVFNFQTVPPGDKYHPTERPVPLMTEILDTFVYPGQLVCSPFLGSGSVLRACYKLGINGFGWDLDEMNKNNFLLKVEEDWKDEK
jgi:DNA modification methylase